MTVRSTELTRGVTAHILISRGAIYRLAFAASAFLLIATAMCRTSLGAAINYGSFMGTDVTYVDVTESSATDPVPLFGAPSVSGNSIDFNPVGFDAERFRRRWKRHYRRSVVLHDRSET